LGEGLKKLIIFFLLPFSPGRRGWGMRLKYLPEKGSGDEADRNAEGTGG